MGVFRRRFTPYAKRRKRVILGSAGSTPTVLFNPTFRHGLLTDGQKRQIVTTDISGMPTAATQAQQETGSSTTVYVSPGRQQYHQSAAKFWLHMAWSGGTPTASASYNVSSLTDTGTGTVTINLTTAFSAAQFGLGMGYQSMDSTVQQQWMVEFSASSASAIRCKYFGGGSLQDNTNYVSVVGFGDQ